jgi:hypothetical protein
MLLPVWRLLTRIRSASSRNEDLERLRARFVAQPSAWSASPELRALALRLRELKRELASLFDGVESCRECGRGEPLPKGRWDGGRCCGTHTDVVFTPSEVHALKLGGTVGKRLQRPVDEQAGCVFRGARGCSIAAEDRPTLCHVYVCAELRGELKRGEAMERIQALRLELHETFEAFQRASGVPFEHMNVPTTLVGPG